MTGGGRGGKSFTDAMHEMIYNVEVGIIMQILGTSSRQHCTLKSQLLLVNISPQFNIKWAHFTLVFPTYVQFCMQIVVLYFFRAFSSANFRADLEKSAHMLRIILPTVFQVIKNLLTLTINKSFNIRLTKSQFSNNHQTSELPFNWYT